MFVFGLSNDCDKDMCKKVAKAGRGTCSLVPDSTDPLNLKAQVSRALRKAMECSIESCKIVWRKNNRDEFERLGRVFQNQLITSTRIMSSADFASLQFTFKGKQNKDI